MTTRDWQEPDAGAYDPERPTALLELASAAMASERDERAVWAVSSMLEAGANTAALTVARAYCKRTRLLSLADFDALVREYRAESGQDSGTGTKSASTVLVELAQARYTFGLGDAGETFALPVSGPKVVAMLRGGKTSLRALLAREYFTQTGKAAGQSALADALTVIEGLAQDSEEQRLYLRCAQHEGSLWLDLGDPTGRAVRVTPDGWTIEDSAPVLFKRTALTGVLPEPVSGGDIADLWTWLNVTKEDQPLVLAELVARLFTEQPHVVLSLMGEQGTGKSTALRVLVSMTDPSPVPLRKAPKDEESWVTAASGSWVVGLDNLSGIPAWLSDALCRASTGDGDVRRRLYTDGDFSVIAFRRCVAFTSIDVGALAGDLADRTLAVTLERIPDTERADEETFWAGWDEAHPRLLGTVLDLASRVLARLPEIQLDRKPRMADFAKILAAVDAELGTSAFDRFALRAEDMASETLDADPFARAIKDAITEDFFGSAGELLHEVTPRHEDWKPPKGWPSTARDATGKLRRLAPVLRKVGWSVNDMGRGGHDKQLRWQISPPRTPEMAQNDARVCPQRPQTMSDLVFYDASSAGNAGMAGNSSTSAGNDARSHAGNAGDSGHDFHLSHVGEEENCYLPVTCQACGEPMTLLTPGQTRHPVCE